MITAFIKWQAIETAESVIVAESLNYLKAQFVFITSDWNKLEKTAYFTQGETTHPIKLDENNIAFPLHLSAGEWAVSVVGRSYKNGELVERITTDTVTIKVKPFNADAGTPFPEAAPTEIEALRGNIGKLSDLATNDKSSLVNAINEVYKNGGSGSGLTEEQTKQISENTKNRHWHNNKNILDDFELDTTAFGKPPRLMYGGTQLATPSDIPVSIIASEINNYFNHYPEKVDIPHGYVGSQAVTELIDNVFKRFATKELVEALGSPLKIELVEVLPETGEEGTIYLVPNGDTETNIYEEYLFVNGVAELIGSTQIDLTNYYTKEEIDEKRATIEKAIEPLSDVQYLNGNLFDPNNIVHGEKYNTTTGVAETSAATVRTKELIPLDKTKEYNFVFYMSDHPLLASVSVYGYVLLYDENKNFIQSRPFNTVKPNGKVLKTVHITGAAYVGFHIVHFNTYYPTESPKVMIYEGVDTEDWGNVEYVEFGVGYGKYRLPRLVIDTEKTLPHFYNKFLKISYSNFDGFAPINTRETYLTACKLGFDAVKGDVRLTSDNGLIMCHDAGLTYDDNGYLTSYDKNNARVIREMTLDECLNSYHAINTKMLNHLGHRTHMTTFEEYIKICREHDKIAFITVRDEYMDIIAPLVLNLLEKYNMIENSIVNSFTLESLQMFRKLNDRVMLSNVLNSGTVLTQTHIDTAVELGNCLICMFPFPNDDPWNTTMEQSKEAMEYANQKGVLIYGAIANKYEDYIKSVHYGLSGLQLSTVVMPYEPKRYLFKVTLIEGAATFSDEFIAEKYTANVTQTESKISISDIRTNGSGSDFDNGLMNLWLNRLPYNLSITEESGKNCDVSFSGSSIDINTNGETSAIYHLCVTI